MNHYALKPPLIIKLIAVVALLQSVTSASAQKATSEEVADIIVRLELYERHCSKLPPIIRSLASNLYHYVDTREMKMPLLNIQMEIERIGEKKWCDLTRAWIETAEAKGQLG